MGGVVQVSWRGGEGGRERWPKNKNATLTRSHPLPSQRLTAPAPSDSDADDSDADAGWVSDGAGSDGAPPWSGGEVAVSPDDEAALAAFARPEGSIPARTLADVILDRIKQRQLQQQEQGGGGMEEGGGEGNNASPSPLDTDARLEAVYRGVGRVLARYTAGALPKAFKVVPSLADWETVLGWTDPSAWSPHATFQATRLFVSSLPPKPAQRFVCLVLLPAVRADIRANRRLHFALYQAVKKAAYKPDAFFKVREREEGREERERKRERLEPNQSTPIHPQPDPPTHQTTGFAHPALPVRRLLPARSRHPVVRRRTRVPPLPPRRGRPPPPRLPPLQRGHLLLHARPAGQKVCVAVSCH